MTGLRSSKSMSYAGIGEETSSGLHTINKPTAGLGHYKVSVLTGAIAAGAQTDGEVIQFRWADATKLCLVKCVSITGVRATTAFAAGTLDIKLTPARAFTAVGSGTASLSTSSAVLASTSVNASGVLTFTALNTAPKVGQTVTINGTMSTGTINGSATQTNAVYYVVGTPTTTTATLSLTPNGAAVTSTASTGAFTGCTSTLSSLLAGNNSKLRTTFSTSLGPTIVSAGTAVLGAGTKVLDVLDTGLISTHTSGGVSAATPIVGSIYLPTNYLYKADINCGEHPLVLAQNEGFVVRVTCPATGVWSLGATIYWTEVSEF